MSIGILYVNAESICTLAFHKAEVRDEDRYRRSRLERTLGNAVQVDAF